MLQILRFIIHHSQLVELHSLVALGNRFYPDIIWWARTQVYPDGVVGVLNRALDTPNIRACRNSVVINLVESETLCCWKQHCFSLLSLLRKQNEEGTNGLRSRPRWWTCSVNSCCCRCSAAVVATIDLEFAGIGPQRADKRKSLVNNCSSSLL